MTSKWRRPAYCGDDTLYDAKNALERTYSVDRDGLAEHAFAQAEALVTRLAELVDRLHAKGVLSDDDVSYLVAGYFEQVRA